MKRLSLVFSMVVMAMMVAVAQRTVVGTVLDDGGEALIGASVLAKSTSAGTVTDVNGKFTLAVPREASVLVISYTGYTTQEITLGASNVVEVRLAGSTVLNEVVVTALGIKRDKKALGYAATVINSDQIAEKPETDVARALIGRSPGLTITNSSGIAGSGTKINIRGTSTVSGNSQPLWVVDGVPINTAANENNKNFADGNITPTRNIDIDPNNIESISILRGLSATTLYGSQGRNGVILVSTKTGTPGKKKFTASLSQSYHQVEAHVPEYQNKWANGFDGDYGEFFSNWGSLFNGKAPTNPNGGVTTPYWRHPYWEHRALFPEFPEFTTIDGKAEATGYIPQPQPNNIKDFFQTGQSATTSFNAGVSNDLGSFNISFAHTNESGYIKNNDLGRTNFSLGGTANISKKLSLSGNFNFVQTDFATPPTAAGLGSNSAGGPGVFANLFYTPRNMDLMGWPYQNPVTGASVYYRNNNSITNPRWLLDNAAQTNKASRLFGNVAASFQINSWAKVMYRLGMDTYGEKQSYHINRGAVGFPADLSAFARGLYRTTNGTNTIFDHSLILGGSRNLSDDLDLSVNIGANGRRDDYDQTGIESSDQVVFGLLEHRNFISNSNRDLRTNPLSFKETSIILGLFGDATLGYRNYVYLNVQARNDWASTHEKDFRTQLYPGFSLSFIPTQAFSGMESDMLNFLKLRIGYGTSANFATPYNTRPTLTLNAAKSVDANGNVITLALPELLANPNLGPELQKELEAGIELRAFNNRVGLEFSVYDRTAEDQIVQRPLDPSTGYVSTFINAGTITNKGVEIGLSITPVKTKNFDWNLRANFTKNKSLVESLPDGSKEFPISGFSNLGAFVVQDEPFSVIKGIAATRNDKGELLITANGDYTLDSEISIIGDPNPDFQLSGFSDINYRGLSLGVQFDYVHGGDIFSYSAGTLTGRGVAKELEEFNPELPIILPGVLADGSPNNIPQPASGVFFGNTIIGGGPDDRGIFDATRARLREVSLTYSVPGRWLGDSFVKGATISLIANNMWFRTFNTPKSSKVDPDRTPFGTDNGIGFDFLSGPSAKRYGLNVKFNF